MAVVSLPEFTNYLSGLNITAVQAQSMQMILDGVQAELEREINRPLQVRRVMEEVSPDFNGNVYLQVTPIQEIYGIHNVNPQTGEMVPAPFAWSELPAFSFRKGQNYFQLGYAGASRYGGAPTFYVDYLGGMNADLDPGAKLAIMRVAAREYMHNHGDALTLANTESRPASDPTPQPKGWQPEELAAFDRLRRRVVV